METFPRQIPCIFSCSESAPEHTRKSRYAPKVWTVTIERLRGWGRIHKRMMLIFLAVHVFSSAFFVPLLPFFLFFCFCVDSFVRTTLYQVIHFNVKEILLASSFPHFLFLLFFSSPSSSDMSIAGFKFQKEKGQEDDSM
ncbi:hypothetical protein SAY86_011417 [Trapa natans]|uniref:Transmembrane protein n=1 Tax=Trapa natans TaxID=22666 RepID=A0AAN7LM49_TRANT|nr:hypothetical protein SAY86_011417 [Trapa natans]